MPEMTDEQILALAGVGYTEGIKEENINRAVRRIFLKDYAIGIGATLEQARVIACALYKWEHQGVTYISRGYIGRCEVCRRYSTFETYQIGKRKGRPKRTEGGVYLYGIKLDGGIIGVTMGGKLYGDGVVCDDCYTILRPFLLQVLRDLKILADYKSIDSECPYRKDNQVECFNCHELVYESEMGRLPTLIGNGSYPGVCPHCGAKSLPFGKNHKSTSNFRIIEG